MNWIDSAVAGHTTALFMRADRAEIIASNLSNSDTPGYQARDIDFNEEFNRSMAAGPTGMSRTNSNHIALSGGSTMELLYRIPQLPSTNGNTVEAETEQANFSENAMQYQASLQFLTSKIRGVRLALRGE